MINKMFIKANDQCIIRKGNFLELQCNILEVLCTFPDINEYVRVFHPLHEVRNLEQKK